MLITNWYVATAVDDTLVDMTDSAGNDTDPATAVNSVGGNTGNAVTASKLIFSQGGDFAGMETPDGNAHLMRQNANRSVRRRYSC